MPSARSLAAAVALAMATPGMNAACGPTGRGGAAQPADLEGFRCNDRSAQFMLVGSFAAAELGVGASCEGDKPVLTKWFVEDGATDRDESTFDISAAEFERLWQQLDDAGWRNLTDCLNPDAGDGEQVATFDITDGDSRVSLACQGKNQPFPYDRLANAFQELARGYGDR